MKKSVFTVMLTAMFIVSFASSTSAKTVSLPKFLYNTSAEKGQVVSKEVCKQMETGGYQRHLKYDYTYTHQGMPASCKASRWNKQTATWENWYLITYTYDEIVSTATLNYALWNKEGNAFDAPKEMTIYQYSADASLLNYAQYKKETEESHWEVKKLFGISNYFVNQ